MKNISTIIFLYFLLLNSSLLAQISITVEGPQIYKNGIPWEFSGTDNMAVFSLPYNYSTQQGLGMDIFRECIDMKLTSDDALEKLVNSARSKGLVVILAGFWYDSDAFSGGTTPYPDCQLLGNNPQSDSRWAAVMNRWKEIANLPFIKNYGDVWINPWNEPYSWDGTNGYTDDLWETDAKAMVDSIRSTGASNVIVIEGSHMGQGHTVILDRGKNVREGRTNIVFDLHCYDSKWNIDVASIRARFQALHNTGNAFIVGEFAANGDHVYQPIMEACRAEKVSLLAWLWGQYKEPFNTAYRNFCKAPRNISSTAAGIEGKSSVAPGESFLWYRLAAPGAEWTMHWSVTGEGTILTPDDSIAIQVSWGCTADTLLCDVQTGTDSVRLVFPVKMDGFSITAPLFADTASSGFTVQTQYAENAVYSWSLPEGAKVLSGADSNLIQISWGGKTDSLRLMVTGGCDTSFASRVLYSNGQYPFPDPSLPHLLPDTLEATEYDYGGEGIAYHDADPQNQGPGTRSLEGVDTEFNDGGENVGWTNAGEWLRYSIRVVNPDTYFTELRVASGGSGGNLNILINGENRLGQIRVPGTSGWNKFISIYPGKLELKETDSILQYSFITGGFNLGRLVLMPLEYVPPSAPVEAFRNVLINSLQLKWYRSTDNDQVKSYIFFLNEDSLRTISDTLIVIKNLTANTNYTFSVVAVDRQGNRSAPLEGSFTTPQPTRVDELSGNEIEIFPNPCISWLNISGNSGQNTTVEFMNATGVLLKTISLHAGCDLVEVPSAIPDGLFFLRVISGQRVQTFKILKN
jgi:mannan endo-1,4-beta-mannosidase